MATRTATASELLREDTFEAERLMELYTLHDHKERHLSRLRGETRTLRGILSRQREIIQECGAVANQKGKDEMDDMDELALKKGGFIMKSGSTQHLSELAELPQRITTTGSCADLLEELKGALANQPERDGQFALDRGTSHAFAKSRQNFFEIRPSELVLEDVREVADFSFFFKSTPLTLLLAIGCYDSSFPLDELLTALDSWPNQRRQDFILAFFHDMRRCATFMSLTKQLMSAKSLSALTKLVEMQVPMFYEARRSCFLSYDSQHEELVFMKDGIKLRFPNRPGIFNKALVTQSPLEVASDDPEVSQTDRVIVQDSKQMLIIPVLSIISQFQVDGLVIMFDKVSGFQRDDYLTMSIIARSVADVVPSLRSLEGRKGRHNAFSGAVETYVELCAAADLKSLTRQISSSFCKHFTCEAVRIFHVSRKRQDFTEITHGRPEQTRYAIGSGIVGSCISSGPTTRVTKAQFSDEYREETDCSGANNFASSLLVGVIPNEAGVAKWAVALYNKRERSSFTSLDEESLAAVCKYMAPLLANAWDDQKMEKKIEESKRQASEAAALMNVIASMKSPTDTASLISHMTAFFKENTEFSVVTLYILDSFRKELYNSDISKTEFIRLDSSTSEGTCALSGRNIEKTRPTDGSKMAFCAVCDSSASIIGVLKLSSPELISQKGMIGQKQGQKSISKVRSSLSMLNTLKSNFGSMVNIDGKASDFFKPENPVPEVPVAKLLKMWQKIAGAILEGANKYRRTIEKKRLVDHMNEILLDNRFDQYFRVWQEAQFLVDAFDDLGDTAVTIKSPVIMDVVGVDTPELVEKMVDLITTLQLVNAIDTTVFPPQKRHEDNAPTAVKDMTVMEISERDDGECIFLSSAEHNFIDMDEGDIIHGIVAAFSELQILRFLNVSEEDMRLFLLRLRAIHPPNVFTSWRLAVDHFQMALYLFRNTGATDAISGVDITASLLFLLSLYSDPCAVLSDSANRKRTKFTLETDGIFSTMSSFFAACAWCDVNIFDKIDPADKIAIYNAFVELNVTEDDLAFAGASPLHLIVFLSRYSYIIRTAVVTDKWVGLKMREDIPPELSQEADEVTKQQLEFEKEHIVLPILDSLCDIFPEVESLRACIIANYSNV